MEIKDNNEVMQYYNMELNATKEEKKLLIEYALKEIVNDEEELVNYAINKLLKQMIGDENFLKNLKKKVLTEKEEINES